MNWRGFYRNKKSLYNKNRGSTLTDKESAQDIDFISTGIQGWSLYEMAALMEHAAHALVDVVPEEQGTEFVDYNIKRGQVVYEQE